MGVAHVVFSRAAQYSLRQVLSVEPLCLDDSLDIGTIVGSRADTWDYLNYDDECIAGIAAFWSAAPAELVVWVSSRNARDLCGLHELVWRRRDVAISVIDVVRSELRITGGDGSPRVHLSVGEIRPDRIVAHDLPSLAAPLTEAERARYIAAWTQLRGENYPLRVITDHGLASAPLSCFDELILSCVRLGWTIGGGIVGDALVRICETNQVIDDVFIFARLRDLVDDGVIEGQCDGDVWGYRNTRFRRPP